MAVGGDIRDTFFQECEELLEALNDGLDQIDAALSAGGAEIETINAVFRAVHSIKGGAGAFGLDELVRFAHGFENLLDAMRSGRVAAAPEVMAICHRASDRLSDLVLASRDDLPVDRSSNDVLLAALQGAQSAPSQTSNGSDHAEADAEGAFEFTPNVLSLDLDPGGSEPRVQGYRLFFSPQRSLYANGNDAMLLFRALAELGALEVIARRDRLPDFDAFDWQESYVDWDLVLLTDQPEESVLEIFEFVDGLCQLEILPIHEVEDASVNAADTEDTVSTPSVAESEQPPDILPLETVSPASVTPIRKATDGGARARANATAGGGAAPAHATVRVDLDRVDRLINAVGELVITQAMLAQRVEEAGISARSDIGAGLDAFRNLAREIQESVMAIRAQSLKPLFQRMSRIVREACDASGKQARLVTEGEATEVDKTVIERLADPLTHMIRNSIDHGLEPPERRQALGKTETGVITLSAAHRSGRVVIEVTDDGAGIDRARVREIAVEKGLIPEDLELSEVETDKLLFMPGFSTAREVSSLSGRGVGMDVVKSSIQALGGRVTIQSAPGRGTTLSISLPLTLAVLDGMVVDIAGQTMVVPITAIVETLRPPPEDIHLLGSDSQVVSIRGSFVPIVDLGERFGHREAVRDFRERVLLLVETDHQERCALAVDAIHDQRQVVIKALDVNYGHVPGVAAATILGDGQIALIIDPEETIATAGRSLATPGFQLSAGG